MVLDDPGSSISNGNTIIQYTLNVGEPTSSGRCCRRVTAPP